MQSKMKQAYIGEIQYQTKMLNNLKRWLKISIILSSLSFAFVLFSPSLGFVCKIIGIIGMVLSIIACILILLGYKNGRNNVNKIIDSLDK